MVEMPGGEASVSCKRCGKTASPPPPHRVPFKALKPIVREGLCASCWDEWEQAEVRVVNEYRLNFLVPEHRTALERACREFLGLPDVDQEASSSK